MAIAIQILVMLVVMYGLAGLCLWVAKRAKADSLIKKINLFISYSIGSFTTGLIALVLYQMAQTALFPTESQVASNRRAVQAVVLTAERLTARVDSLEAALARSDSVLASMVTKPPQE